MKRKKYTVPGCSDATMMALWRNVVWGRWGSQCAFADTLECFGPMEAHHVVRRGVRPLRYSPLNGVLLCRFHHDRAKYRDWQAMIDEKQGEEVSAYLSAVEKILYPDFLIKLGMSRKEYLLAQKEYLMSWYGRTAPAGKEMEWKGILGV